jgi:hypothetical protein
VVCCTKSVRPILVIGLTGFGGTGLTGLCLELALVQEEHAYVQAEFLYALVVCALCLSIVLSWICRVVALA